MPIIMDLIIIIIIIISDINHGEIIILEMLTLSFPENVDPDICSRGL